MNRQEYQDEATLARSSTITEELHGVSAEDLYPGDCYSSPAAIRAAANEDPNVLRTILAYGNRRYTKEQIQTSNMPLYHDQENEYGPNATDPPDIPGYVTPLLQAITSPRPENVATLLSAGADLNGIPWSALLQNAGGFLRFGPHYAENPTYMMEDKSVYNREYLLSYISTPQLTALTWEETRQRFDCPKPSRFWSEVDFRPLEPVPNADSIPALVAAAEKSDIATLKSLLDAPGTDTSFWTTYPQAPYISKPETASSLAISTPLHAAIRGRNLQALSLLLSAGFNPNALPLAAPTRCISPPMATIVHCEPWNEEAYNILAGHPLIDLNIRTPVYDVSILHFAVARLDLHLLKRIAVDVPLSNAGRTALGHTLLHIACLPLDESWVQTHSEPIFKSCHETRNLSELEVFEEGTGEYVKAREVLRTRAWTVVPTLNPDERYPRRFTARPKKGDIEDAHKRQMEVVMYLLETCQELGFEAMDIHGNSPLHYLACHRNINEKLLDLLWDLDGVRQTCWTAKNRYGFTAAELFDSGRSVVEDGEMGFWRVIDAWEEERRNEGKLWEDKFARSSAALVKGLYRDGE